jgi:hypothetical protein
MNVERSGRLEVGRERPGQGVEEVFAAAFCRIAAF